MIVALGNRGSLPSATSNVCSIERMFDRTCVRLTRIFNSRALACSVSGYVWGANWVLVGIRSLPNRYT